MRMARWAVALGMSVGLAGLSGAADWSQFRGAAGNGVAEAVALPMEWATDRNLAWKAKLPGSGWAQPVVVGKTLFIASAVGESSITPKNFITGVMDPRSRGGKSEGPPDVRIQWQLSAMDAETGKLQWTKTVAAGKPKFGIHPSNSYATETPAADAKRVAAFFGATGTLAMFDHSGKELWKKELGAYPTTAEFGSGSSPVLIDETVIVQLFNETKAELLAFDATTGAEKWKVSREKPGTSWATPVIWRTAKRSEVIALGRGMVTAHDPATGKELWRLNGVESSFSSSAAVSPDYLCFGNSGPGSSGQLFAIKAGATGDITLQKGEKSNAGVAWLKTAAGPGMASPIAANGLLYVLNNSGLSCYDLATGEQKYRERLPKARTIAACPVLADGRLLIVDEAGTAFQVKVGTSFEVLNTSKLEDTFWASPAVTESAIYLRGLETLYCIRKSS
ncbi:outer membrane protein assembly factor BamB family protein [Tuwongella immobilis]|uniref:Pyrrolo-quinoline quinone repeat domain-containing protein n=1 Tax=Tuwongella immobilis TaxID=692036 RepID=A0A6C2YPR0_9BACT|nr:PQQ-binding-like beta-propeller repeat protein [Tuwongella immobilis]VIP02872.1 Uncharacterized protein OS=Pirellula staleyi (strain ATCC 27377 / DSM 6068 / ICPB 4128) GN=Psta_1473 PE=4 SV=1: PQQ_2 [Tuwongella immobilis]VTS02704.1 Uncharacterized protein OS=Pirellula staleyi (strain ATCC 27377 / DSM 6068 / ICPB 4128) GN=Psta_1473 PE=4 SV=1: PQQ_2 [Tuwongella immobilis]